MVEIVNLCKTYGVGASAVVALKDVNITIGDGEIFGIIGLSGAGKTSLVRCINLLELPTSGHVIIDGQDITMLAASHLRQARRKIGMIFQHFNLLMNSTIYENIAFPMKISGKSKEDIDKKVNELLALVDLADKRDAYPAMLSGGQKQRIGIARALAAEPGIILCDEATSALDPATTKSILELLRDVNKKLGITIIIITHEMDVVKDICSRVAILEGGEVVEQDKITDIFISPKTKTARRFFRDVATELDHDVYKKATSGNATIIKAVFVGESSTDPYISTMIKEHGVVAAILSGNIQNISNTLIGTLVIKLEGDAASVGAALSYLQRSGVMVEVLNNAV